MRLAFTSGSIYNSYIAVLIYELIGHEKIVGVLCSQKPRSIFLQIGLLLLHIKKKGIASAMERTIKTLKKEPPKISKYVFLEKYARQKGFSHWNKKLADVCKEKGIAFRFIEGINSAEVIDFVRENNIDILINGGGGIFKKEIIDAVKIGILNVHMGLLPDFRGMNVLEWSIFYNKPLGVTVHFIDRAVDIGDILLFEEIVASEGDTISTLRAKVQPVYVALMKKCLSLLEQGRLQRIRQQPAQGKQYFVMHPRLKQLVENKLKCLKE